MQGQPQLLVLGCGFIGTAVVQAALRRGIAVRVLTRSVPAGLPIELRNEIDLRIGNVADEGNISKALDSVDHVVYAVGDLWGGISAPDAAAALLNEAQPLLRSLEACRHVGSPGFTYISSGGTVYGPAKLLPIPEDHPTEPLATYGVAKLACEKYALMYARLYGLRVRVVRCANAYGEGQPVNRPQGFIGVALDRINRRQPITVYGDGSVVRDYIHVDDVASAIIDLRAALDEPRLVNVGSGVGTTIRALLLLFAQVTGRVADVQWEPARGFDLDANILDISRLKELVDFDPIPLERGIGRAWKSQRCDETDSTA